MNSYRKRFLIKDIQPYVEHKNAIVLTGSRQVGKTSLLRYFFHQLPEDQRLWFDFDNPVDQKFFEDMDYKHIYERLFTFGISKTKRPYIFIDEIQNFPAITQIMKYLIDHYGVKFFVTGSSSFYMKNLFPESLSGRKFVFTLYPLSFQEFLYFQDKIEDLPDVSTLHLKETGRPEYSRRKSEFDEFLEFGSFPEVVLTPDVSTKKMVLKNIFSSFFERDILQLADYQDVREIRDTILLLTQRVGSKLDVSRLASELGVQRYRVYSHLEFLQATFFIYLVGQFTKSIDKHVASSKKVYFMDTGMLNMLGNVSEGALFENAVGNILKPFGELHCYQKKAHSREIDFILNGKTAFEVKHTACLQDLKTLDVLTDSIGLSQSHVISRNFVDIKKVLYPQCMGE